ncbi:MAG TPA: NADP-dependent oxidoreductase [Pseudolysinimonas sp.]|jgi:NADPH:quinone reductase-like Zn-dependent oxidoreductase
MPASSIPTTMRALRVHELAEPGQVRLETLPTPVPADGELLIRVRAAAVTRDELSWPEGRLPATPCYEFSGEVVALGASASAFEIGEAVYGMALFDRDGAASEYFAAPERVFARKPANLDHPAAAAVPLPALSAWQALFDHGLLESGQRVLVHGATGAVGHLAVQLARRASAHVIATASAANLDAARDAGADEVVDRATNYEASVQPVDLVFDAAGGDAAERSAVLVRPGGRLVSIISEPAPTPGITSRFFIVEPNREELDQVTGLVESGGLRLVSHEEFPLDEAMAAFEASLDRSHRGKVVFSPIA